MSDAPASIDDMIARWPTIVEFAADVGCGYEAARKMRDRKRIAPEHWPAVVSACERRGIVGVTTDWLTQQRAAKADEAAA